MASLAGFRRAVVGAFLLPFLVAVPGALVAPVPAGGVPVPAGAAPPPSGAPPPGSWSRPVQGRVVRPFVEPASRYGPGHRGADLSAAPATPVRAAGDGVVAFAGDVAGTLHVVVAHLGGLRTSYSFLSTVGVRAGQAVRRGDAVGAAGGSGPEHPVGVLHLGLRVGERYVDPMALFAPPDLSKLIRLAPVDVPPQPGLDRPALAPRDLASSLHLGLVVPGWAGAPATGGVGGADAVSGGGLDPLGAIRSAGRGVGSGLGAAAGGLAWLGSVVGKVTDRSPLAPVARDVLETGRRVLDRVRSRFDCTADASTPGGLRGSGHMALAVAGINSSTDPLTGATFGLEVRELGYREGEVRYFSYAASGGSYERDQTWGDLRVQAARLGDQLRRMQAENPGREVDLVAYSQGGVVVDLFLQQYFEPGDPTLPPIGTVVTLASPHRGAPLATGVDKIRETASGRSVLDAAEAALGAAVPPSGAAATQQLSERSPVMRGLWKRRLPEQVDFTTIAGANDVVVPADRTAVPGATSVTVDPAGINDHAGILRDPEALTAARLALEGRPPPCAPLADSLRAAVGPVVITRVERTAGDLGRRAGQVIDQLTRQGGRS